MSKNKLMYEEVQENLKKDLEKLRKFLNYKNANFCKKKLELILHHYFGNQNNKVRD